MRLTQLKKLRLLASLTQADVARKLKISQPTYQRWESGALPIAHAKRKSLAKLFSVKEGQLDDISEAFDYLGIDTSSPEERRYYGEVAVHFRQGPPILSPISFAERTRILAMIDSRSEVVTFRSLDNWTVVLCARNVLDIFVSSDACDEYGPEADKYSTHLGVYPDPAFWEIVEYAEVPEAIEGVPAERVKGVLAGLEFDEDVFQQAISNGQATEADRAAIQSGIAKDAPAFAQRASMLTWQFANGTLRNEYVESDEELAATLAAFAFLSHEEWEMIHLQIEGWHRSICINAGELSYIAFPTHRVDRGKLGRLGDEIDGNARSPR